MNWQRIETLNHDNDVLLGKWVDADPTGYFGEARWLWIASGNRFDSGSIWIDFTDDEHSGFSHQHPTHWAHLPPPPPADNE